MNAAKSVIAIIIAAGIIFCCFGIAAAQKPLKISIKDKKNIIKQIFDAGFEKLMRDDRFWQCTIPLVDEKKIILVRTDEPNLFPREFGEYRFKILSKKQIEDEIKSNDGDCFFDTGQFIKIGPGRVKLSFWRWINVITVSGGKSLYPARWVYASGLVYEAVKVRGKWKVKFLNSTAVVS